MRKNTLEGKVISMVASLPSCATNLDGARRVFEFDLPKLKSGNNAKTDIFYKCIQLADKLEIWHCNIYSKPDRLLAIIKEVSNEI